LVTSFSKQLGFLGNTALLFIIEKLNECNAFRLTENCSKKIRSTMTLLIASIITSIYKHAVSIKLGNHFEIRFFITE